MNAIEKLLKELTEERGMNVTDEQIAEAAEQLSEHTDVNNPDYYIVKEYVVSAS